MQFKSKLRKQFEQSSRQVVLGQGETQTHGCDQSQKHSVEIKDIKKTMRIIMTRRLANVMIMVAMRTRVPGAESSGRKPV